jgi:hypothetical protein
MSLELCTFYVSEGKASGIDSYILRLLNILDCFLELLNFKSQKSILVAEI